MCLLSSFEAIFVKGKIFQIVFLAKLKKHQNTVVH